LITVTSALETVEATKRPMKIGIGYDAHPFTEGRTLTLGGVVIPYHRGLAGWSDGDVLTHAIIDALLGAAGLGSIGQHFPPGAAEWRGIPSLKLLEKVGRLLAQNRLRVVNIDLTVVAKEPKIMEHAGEMKTRLGASLGSSGGAINIKASTGNGLGAAGRGEGIEVHAAVLIELIIHD
jgi:2-C-methyl-D-erythritol 2,4-cyclodiphosphate synthase